jgi:hypothetical protein
VKCVTLSSAEFFNPTGLVNDDGDLQLNVDIDEVGENVDRIMDVVRKCVADEEAGVD